MAKRRVVKKHARTGEPEQIGLDEFLRRVFQLLGDQSSRKFNWWLSAEDHEELSRRAYSYAQHAGLKRPSLHQYLAYALELPSHKARLKRLADKGVIPLHGRRRRAFA